MAETQGIAEQSEICLVLTAREDVACTEAVLECIYIYNARTVFHG